MEKYDKSPTACVYLNQDVHVAMGVKQDDKNLRVQISELSNCNPEQTVGREWSQKKIIGIATGHRHVGLQSRFIARNTKCNLFEHFE